MSTTSLINDRRTCFQFKASFSPCTILQIMRLDLEVLLQQLEVEVARAPNFFIGSPVVIDIEKIKGFDLLDFFKLKNIIISAGLVPVGVRGGSEKQMMEARSAGLPIVTIGKTANTETSKKAPKSEMRPTKLITVPIRSGMQVYAKESDLIVVAPVSSGAELLADGHIHVYGPLRGRALAGVQGRVDARIFCHTLEAELVSIAGFYLTKEDIQPVATENGMIQIYLENGQVRMEAI